MCRVVRAWCVMLWLDDLLWDALLMARLMAHPIVVSSCL
jgi:hypothetical protein